jgi:hypothetical protein
MGLHWISLITGFLMSNGFAGWTDRLNLSIMVGRGLGMYSSNGLESRSCLAKLIFRDGVRGCAKRASNGDCWKESAWECRGCWKMEDSVRSSMGVMGFRLKRRSAGGWTWGCGGTGLGNTKSWFGVTSAETSGGRISTSSLYRSHGWTSNVAIPSRFQSR